MKILFAVILLVLVDSTGTLLIAQGMKQVGEISTLQPRKLLKIARRLVKNHLLWLGFLFQASTFFLFLTVLSWADLSLVVPLCSLGYVVIILGRKLLVN